MVASSPHARLRAARQALGLSDAEVAGRTGLALADYASLEETAIAIREAVDLRRVKRVADLLGLDLFALLGLACAYCAGQGPPARDEPRPTRDARVRARRQALGLSAGALAARLGVRAETVEAIARDPNALDTWPAAFVEDLARLLEVPPQVLLDLPCPACWR